MTPEPPIPCTILSSTVLPPVENILASGSDRRPPRSAYSTSPRPRFVRSYVYANNSLPRALADANETSLRVYSTGNFPEVYEDSFMAVAKPDGKDFQPTLILVGTRLGTDKINQVYEQALISALQLPQSIGIAGYVPPLDSYLPFFCILTRIFLYVVAGPLPLTTL